MKTTRVLALSVLTVLVACSAAQMSIPLTQLVTLNAANNAFSSQTTLVVRDQESWQELWSRMNATISPAPPVPAVDFSKDLVLVAAAGTRPTGGFSVAITNAAESGGEVIVNATITSPGRNCIVTQALTSPVHAVTMARRDAPISFQVGQEVRNC
jgi:hypothetical protein